MKIYLFNPETGVYLGEGYADEAPMGRNSSVVPPYATTLAPPSAVRGQLPVFNAAKQRWHIRQRPEKLGEWL
jgi:hypothetical protein